MDHQKRYPIPENIKDIAIINGPEHYQQIYQESINHKELFWGKEAKRLDWFKNYDEVMAGDFERVNFRWFQGGKLNVAYNCIDRHLAQKAAEPAIIWAKDQEGDYQTISYQTLHDKVCQTANMLKSLGVGKGDRVCLYLPMIPELSYCMLACARIGAIHSVVFAGFSAEALRGRIEDSACKILITANEGLRGGKNIPLKKIVDQALNGTHSIEHVLVVNRTDKKTPMQDDRDRDFTTLLEAQRPVCPCEWLDAEDPLFILYTSGSTGKPKGLVHTTAGYLLFTAMTFEYTFNYQPGDIYFCAADIGWITGHSYIVYGPLANGATTVMFESTPTYPHPGRYWKVIEDLKVTSFYTAPTALRAIAHSGDEHVNKYDLSSLKILGTVGEPINPETWQWYYQVVGKKNCAIVDTWWQTETGGHMITPLPGAIEAKPGSATLPMFGIETQVVNPENGDIIEGDEAQGALCLTGSWPGQARSIWGDHQRFIATYFKQYPGKYFTGDGCIRDKDGYLWITGRIDDVLNVSGHRLGTAEIESAIMEHTNVAEVAVVGIPHDIKGTGILAYVILENPNAKSGAIEDIKNIVRDSIGRFAAPEKVLFIPGLPKTRSGKVMRRILRKIACGQGDSIGDISTLADPEVVAKIKEVFKASQ